MIVLAVAKVKGKVHLPKRMLCQTQHVYLVHGIVLVLPRGDIPTGADLEGQTRQNYIQTLDVSRLISERNVGKPYGRAERIINSNHD